MNASITTEIKKFRLQPKQREFCQSEADIVIYGGSAGGGKTFALLYEPLSRQLHEVPGFSGVVFRLTHPQITNTGGLWDESSALYPWVGARGYIGACEWRFPAGTKISFRHLEHEQDKHNYQGAQICYLAFDELTHFTESQFWYMLSRNRSTCGVRPYVRCTCNPDPGWVKTLLEPWVDDSFAGSKATSGELRWFVRTDGRIKWVERGVKDAKSLTFIRSSIYDNQILLQKDPDYIATLKALPPVERARLLDGDWNVRREGLVYGGFESCIVDSLPQQNISASPAVGGIDFGFHNPFAALWGNIDHDGVLWITGMRYKSGCTMPVHSEALPKGVHWWCDPAGADSWQQLRQAGHSVTPCVHMPSKGAGGEKRNPKLSGIDQVSERMRVGKLKIVRETCLPLVRELSMYCYDPDKKLEEPIDEDNHACDALRYLVVGLDRGRSVPSIVEVETDQAKAIREQTAKATDLAEREEVERLARLDPFDDRLFGGSFE